MKVYFVRRLEVGQLQRWSVHPQERRSFLLVLSAILQAQLRSQERVPRRVRETAATHPGVIARHGNV